ncbi:MAG: hypothetical protein ACK2VD_17360 [Anaerolineae bacterium]
MIIDRPDRRQEVHDAHGGRGSLSVYGFSAAPGGEIGGEDLPMPEAISGWA